MEGQLSIFDFLQSEKKPEIDNAILKQLIEDLEKVFPGKLQDIEYTVWEHVPNLGKRLWLYIDDVGNEWDLTEIIEKYAKYSLEVSISAVPRITSGAFVGGHNLYVSTMWKTKGHKELNVLPCDECAEDKGEPLAPAEEYYRDTGRTDYWQQSEGKPYQFWKTECQFSGHTCNKEEFWKIAKEFDDITCPEKCCRSCDQKLCGARCNGSEEPPKCKQADECEAYKTKGCGGTVEPCRFGGPFNWSARSAYDVFHEHCTHRGWHRQADEEKGITASWMCGYPEGKPARGWEDWVECTEENCWLLKKGEE